MDIDENNINELKFFETTKDLSLEDGSRIKEGTEFLVEGYYDDKKVALHFSADEENKYKNEFGDEYFFSLEQIREFAKPTDYSIEDYNKTKSIESNNLIEKGEADEKKSIKDRKNAIAKENFELEL